MAIPRSLRLIVVVASSFAIASFCFAETREVRVASREELDAALAEAKAGTSILLEPGTYRGGIIRRSLRGTEAEPIVIGSADPERPATIEGGPSGLHLSSPEYVTLRDLVFTGQGSNGLNIDDGGSAERPAKKVTLKNLWVHDVGPDGNRDGIKLSGLVDFRIEHCVVERWGKTGSGIDMVGCSQGVVERCRFSHPGAVQANGVQTKGGSRDVVIRRCTFLRAGGRAINVGGSTGLAYFRPEPQGFEAKNITVEDCTFVGSLTPIAFVGVDGAVVRHCTIYDPERWCLRILQENQLENFIPCRNGRFEKNVIAFQANQKATLEQGEFGNRGSAVVRFMAVNVGEKTAPETFIFADNVWSCLDRPERTEALVQLPTKEQGGRYDVPLTFEDAGDAGMQLTNAEALGAGVRPER
jgi:hypothetical protein